MASHLTPNLVVATLAVVALSLTVVALRAWWFTRSRKVLILAAAFLLFFAKGTFLSIGLFTSPTWQQDLFLPSLVVDVGVLLLFYWAMLRRS